MPQVSIVVLLVEEADCVLKTLTYYASQPAFNNASVEFVFVALDCSESFLHDYFYPHFWDFEDRGTLLKINGTQPIEDVLEDAFDTCDGSYVQIIACGTLLHKEWLQWGIKQISSLTIGSLEPVEKGEVPTLHYTPPVTMTTAFPRQALFIKDDGITIPFALGSPAYGYTKVDA